MSLAEIDRFLLLDSDGIEVGREAPLGGEVAQLLDLVLVLIVLLMLLAEIEIA